MRKSNLSILLTTTSLFVTGAALAAAPAIDADDIGGVVTGATGPEAGVWVIAETSDLSTHFTKIVITDDAGRYVLPDLPKASYKVWVRGYGLQDSTPVEGVPGKITNHTVTVETDPRAAAQLYPASYWSSMIAPPAASEFPGTGPQGNGIAPNMPNQQAWMAHMKEQCHYCHQVGSKATREGATTEEGWAERLNKARATGDHVLGDHGPRYSLVMNNNMTRFGRARGLQMYADWSKRIADGEVPGEKPPRPAGAERNLVLTMWDWADGHYIHDEATSDKRDATVNAKGPTYGVTTLQGYLAVLDPVSHTTDLIPVPDLDPAVKRIVTDVTVHNPMLDSKKRVWMTIQGASSIAPDECGNPDKNKFAKYYPNRPSKESKRIAVYDPATKEMTTMPVCFGNHHLAFGWDKDNTLYFSGDSNVLGWINTRVYDETKNSVSAIGWCPMVLDTNGDGKIDPVAANWNQPKGTEVTAGDPKKDTRISGFLYGLNTNPVDDSVWSAKYVPNLPSGIIRLSPGKAAPETCMTEYYEPPKRSDGTYAAYGARGLDFDSKGIAWIGFSSGQLGKFDRAKCKVRNGASALGQQCPEGWAAYDSPGPKVSGQAMGSADFHYLAWVDLHDTFGLGKDTPMLPGSNSDSLLAFNREQEKFVVLRVPYPMGFYTRGLDGRIDDASAGWKGKGLWATYGEAPLWHQEDGEGSSSKMIQFQHRPDPLAH